MKIDGNELAFGAFFGAMGALVVAGIVAAFWNPFSGFHCTRDRDETRTVLHCMGVDSHGVCTAYVPVSHTETVCDVWERDK